MRVRDYREATGVANGGRVLIYMGKGKLGFLWEIRFPVVFNVYPNKKRVAHYLGGKCTG